MRAPDALNAVNPDTDHGIQSERPTPGLDVLQAKVSELVDEPVILSDLRWSSIFRLSMRLANSYQAGCVFLAGDAAHIHLPTGGQGMNTSIQDAYNLAWKLALLLKGVSPENLLESYTVERREEGEKVIERTLQASMGTSNKGFRTGRLTDTQLLVTYRTSPWVSQDTAPTRPDDALRPGDRAPDCTGLRRQGVGYAFRLFDVLRGTVHVLLVDVRSDTKKVLDDLYQLALRFQEDFGADFGCVSWPSVRRRIASARLHKLTWCMIPKERSPAFIPQKMALPGLSGRMGTSAGKVMAISLPDYAPV